MTTIYRHPYIEFKETVTIWTAVVFALTLVPIGFIGGGVLSLLSGGIFMVFIWAFIGFVLGAFMAAAIGALIGGRLIAPISYVIYRAISSR
jgi:hypothetical protein